MSLMLSIFIDVILPIIILIVAIAIAIVLYKLMQKKFKKPLDNSSRKNDIPEVKLRNHYCSEKEMKFLEALHKALPRDCISFPNVGLTKLIEPKNNMLDYNDAFNKYLDICIFLRKEMKPILVIDLYEPSPASQQLKKFDDTTARILKTVKIPILHKQIEKEYNIDNLKFEVLQAMDSATVTYLKDKFVSTNGNK